MKICVVGTGTMGHGIVQAFAQAGYDVLMKGRSENSINKALQTIDKSLSRLVEKGKMEAAKQTECYRGMSETDKDAYIKARVEEIMKQTQQV